MIGRPHPWMIALGLTMACAPNPGDDTGPDSAATTSNATSASDSSGGPVVTGDGDSTASAESSTGEPTSDGFAELEEMYEACGREFHPTCIGLDCGTDPVSSKYAAMVIEQITDAGLTGVMRLTDAEANADDQSFDFYLQTQVDWYRYQSSYQLKTDAPDDEMRARARKFIDGIAEKMPATIALSPDDVTTQASACEGMVYTLCKGHVSPRSIHFIQEIGDPCAGGHTDDFAVDLATGETTCTPDAPTACGAATHGPARTWLDAP